MPKPTDAWLRGGAGPMRDRRARRPKDQERRDIQERLEEAEPELDADVALMEVGLCRRCGKEAALVSGFCSMGCWIEAQRDAQA